MKTPLISLAPSFPFPVLSNEIPPLRIQVVGSGEAKRFDALLETHHYLAWLGARPVMR